MRDDNMNIQERFQYWIERFGDAFMGDGSTIPGIDGSLESRIDHTLLDFDAGKDAVTRVCREAVEYHLRAVCIAALWIGTALKERKDRDGNYRIVTVADFPLGAGTAMGRFDGVRRAFEAGADEVDLVIPVGKVMDGDSDYVYRDLKRCCSMEKPVKIILEMSALPRENKVDAAIIAILAGASCLKTSTGINGGADVRDVRLLREIAGERVLVKASGGIRTRKEALLMVEAGADIIGTSSSLKIMK